MQLVYVSGTVKVAGDEPFLACTVRPVNPPTVLELRMEGNMFVAHYSMENMACIYFDGRYVSQRLLCTLRDPNLLKFIVIIMNLCEKFAL